MDPTAEYFYAFGEFRLDPKEKNLYFGGSLVPLKPKAVEILIVLVEQAPSTVSKAHLMEVVWHDAFVEENNLSVNIYEIRRALAKFDRDRKFILTIPRKGFRFEQEVEKVAVDANFPAQDAAVDIGPLRSRLAVSKGTPINNRFLIAFCAVAFLIVGAGFLFASRRSGTGRIEDGTMQPATGRGTESVEAYQLYLRGRELWQTRLNSNMEKGIDFFHRAIEIDPNFVAPYLGIADSLSMMRNDPEDWRQAEEYTRKALAMAPESGDAHASLGFILAMNKWQWDEAEAEFQKAIALDNGSGKAHQWYATLLEIERRFPEAEAHLKKAIEIEPLSPNYNVDLCELYFFANRYDDAFEQCRRTNEINPDFPLADAKLHIYLQQKRYDEAAQVAIENSMRLGSTEEKARNEAWYLAYRKNGFRGWMQYNIDVNQGRPDILLTSYEQSLNYARLGDAETTLKYLDQCVNGRAFMVPFVNARPEYDFLREDPRFRNMMARIGLPQS